MELIHTLINIVAPLILLTLLVPILLIHLLCNLVSFVKRTICSENVAGKVVLITGAASGIGEQIAYEYCRRKALLVLVDINEENLVQVSNEANSIGSGDVVSIVADVSKVEDCERFINEAITHFGRLDHLVNNAGIGKVTKFEDISNISDHNIVMDVNFWGTVNSIHFAIPHLKKTKGKIVVVSSVCGWYPLPKLAIYNASKAALINFCETIRTELGSAIGITLVTPGIIKTNLTRNEDLFQTIIPQGSAEQCAKGIVKSACRGDFYVTEPQWCRWLFPVKVIMLPQVVEWCNRRIFMFKVRESLPRGNIKVAHMKTSQAKSN